MVFVFHEGFYRVCVPAYPLFKKVQESGCCLLHTSFRTDASESADNAKSSNCGLPALNILCHFNDLVNKPTHLFN